MKNHEKAARATIRRHMRRIGAERYRITSDGEVHFYGVMPNANRYGWYLLAQDVDEALSRIAQNYLD